MSLWDWVDDFEEQAHHAGDRARSRLGDLYRHSWHYSWSNPDRALALLSQGRELAQQLGEHWWMLFFDHWRLQTLIGRKRDFGAALDLAARSTVEARKSTYLLLPQRICLHEDLISSYIGIDPVGNAERIQTALNYMQAEVSPNVECHLCHQALQVDFALATDLLEAANAGALRYLGLSQLQDYTHHVIYAYALLCRVAHRLVDWSHLLEWSTAGVQIGPNPDATGYFIECLAWQALAFQHTGNTKAARRTYQSLVKRTKGLGFTPEQSYFNALSAYHEAQGELKQALSVRDEELKHLIGKGQVQAECYCRIERCRLLKLMGQPIAAELVSAREAAHKLIDPAVVLVQLEQIA